MQATDKRDLFEFMIKRVQDTQRHHLEAEPQAFGRWFSDLFFLSPRDMFVSDGSKDGKIDAFFTTHDGKSVVHHVLNTKYTKEFNKIAPPAFYEEMKYFWHAFENREVRSRYLEKAVKQELRPRYRQLFERYDNGAAELMFVTNHRRNEGHFEQVKNIPVKVFHLDDLIQCLVDDIDGAMPRTPDITLNSIHAVLAPDKADTEVATSIVFARLLDFIRYMEADPFDLLFNRNVRVAIDLARSEVNRAIRETFAKNPKEFAFSNNGITLLCEKQHYDPGQKILTLENPRVVNGSQTLHSIRDVTNPSANARVMVRVIEIEPPLGDNLDHKILRRKEIINKIAVRSNQQNPIKSWDLVSNDDFQLDIFRFFRSKGLFYERRNREWNKRSRELRSVHIKYGKNIKLLAQIVCSYYWSKPRLGPVAAKKVKELFEGDLYTAIRLTSPELVFQLHILDENLWECERDLSREKVYIRNLKSYSHFAVFALLVRSLQIAGAKFGEKAFTEHLERQWDTWDKTYRLWKELTKACVAHIVECYKIEARNHRGLEGEDLTHANYFKNQGYISKALNANLRGEINRFANTVINGSR